MCVTLESLLLLLQLCKLLLQLYVLLIPLRIEPELRLFDLKPEGDVFEGQRINGDSKLACLIAVQIPFGRDHDLGHILVEDSTSDQRLKDVLLAPHVAPYLVEFEQSVLEDVNKLLDALSDEVSYLLWSVHVCSWCVLVRLITAARPLTLTKRVNLS